MKITNKKEWPLVLLKAINEILFTTRKIASEHQNSITYTEATDSICVFSDKDKKSLFKFSISDIELSDDRSIHFSGQFQPVNAWSIESSNFSGCVDTTVLKLLNEWIAIVKNYSQFHLSEEQKIDSKAEEEIYDLFDFVDEDANNAAFDLKQQLYLDDALANIEETLEAKKDEYEVAEIIEEVKVLRAALPNETKKAFGKKLSKLFVAVKKKGIPLFKEVVKEFFKDMAKKGIEGGFHRMIEFFQ
jgi:hypothetical protein